MDDIAFFESKQYRHRGGIWGDASRKERTVSEMLDEQQKLAATADNVTGNRTQSLDGLPASSVGSVDAEADGGVKRASTVGAPELLEVSKQKSWFGSTRSTDTSSLGIPTVDEEQEPSTSSEDRGRGLTVEAPSRRATSVPASKSGSGSNSPAEDDNAITIEVQQDSTTFSRIRSLSSGAGMGVPPEASDALNQGTSRDSISANSLGTGSNTPTNTSSILSALKSKDKQALNAAAKEAMRKWSVNWNGFKRGRIGTGGESSGQEDHMDGAPQSATSSIFSFPTGEGRSYADIRAAVAGRKDKKERESVSQERLEGPSRPINIPPKKANADDVADPFEVSAPSGHGGDKDFDANPSTPPQSSSPRGPSLLRKESSRAAPSPPKVTTESHIPEASQLSTPVNDQQEQSHASASFAPPPSPPLQAPPIKTQPSQAAMMTIPGIHASHRGDVMSMGYVAPSPSPPPIEHKLRTPTIPPTIQNMYRLFKSPTSSGSALQRQQQQSPKVFTEPEVDAQGSPSRASSERPKPSTDANEDVLPLTLSPIILNASPDKVPAPSKLIPPALPPRATPASPPPASPLPRPESGQSLNTLTLSASDALKLVAEQDEAKRRSLEAAAEGKTVRSKRNSLGAKRISRAEIPPDLLALECQDGLADPQQSSNSAVAFTGDASRREIRQETPQEQPSESEGVNAQNEVHASIHRGNEVNEVPEDKQPELPRRTPPPLPPRKPSLPARA